MNNDERVEWIIETLAARDFDVPEFHAMQTEIAAKWKADRADLAAAKEANAELLKRNILLRDDLAVPKAPLQVRGYARLGVGAYIINHSAYGEPAELVITFATDKDKATRVIGDDVYNPPDSAPIQPDEMIVRLRFENVAGLDALCKQLELLRRVHFPDSLWKDLT